MEVGDRMGETQCSRRGHWTPLGLAACLALVASLPARAADELGAYIGAAIGEGWVKTSGGFLPGTGAGPFSENHSAYQLMAGVRPIPLLGAELAHVDFGHPHQVLSTGVVGSADVRMKGSAAFGILYLPVPVPVVGIYLKGGLARIQTSANVTGRQVGLGACAFGFPDCGHFAGHNSATDTRFAAGVGAQFKLGSWALRAEYERFTAAGENPSLATVGVTWTFL
jgi:opacity protein-like surface antigen